MTNYVYPSTVAFVGAVSTGLDALADAMRDEETGFELGSIPLISETTGGTIAVIVWDDDGHAVVEWQ